MSQTEDGGNNGRENDREHSKHEGDKNVGDKNVGSKGEGGKGEGGKRKHAYTRGLKKIYVRQDGNEPDKRGARSREARPKEPSN